MKATRIKDGWSGFTSVEVMMLLTVLIVILAGVVLPRMARAKGGHSPSFSCVRQLKSVGLSMRIWANDNHDLYPMQVPDTEGGAKDSVMSGNLARVFQVMSNELSVPRSVLCPAESNQRTTATNWETLQNANVSYFVGLAAADTRPDTILSGDRDIAENGQLLRGTANLTTNRPVAWHKLLHKEGGNILLADGSVQQVPTDLLRQQLKHSGDATNLLVFPQ